MKAASLCGCMDACVPRQYRAAQAVSPASCQEEQAVFLAVKNPTLLT